MFIDSTEKLANMLKIKISDLTFILYKTKSQNDYQSFQIPKKMGGFRNISAPNPKLKGIQRRILNIIYKKYKEINSKNNICHGFLRKKSIITNANIHRNKKLVLNVDLLNFFDHFHFGRVMGYFEKNKYFQTPHGVAVILAKICCYNGKLPQGAPTSPMLTNLICQSMDCRIATLCKKYKLLYTRYADDLTFSTNDSNFQNSYQNFLGTLKKIIEESGFEINNDKTRLQDQNHKQKVTGLIVNEKVNVDKNYFRYTKAMALSLYKNGEFFIEKQKGTLKQLEGRFAFINQVDKFNNSKEKGTCKNKRQSNLDSYNGRERQYRLFLLYNKFIHIGKPIIMVEGKTDILHIKASLKSMYENYPLLITKNPDGTFTYNISFFKKNSVFDFFFKVNKNGASAMDALYNFYAGGNNKYYFTKLKNYGVKATKPFIFLYDNEQFSDRPLKGFLNKIKIEKYPEDKQFFSDNLYLKLKKCTNLFLLTHKIVNNKSESEIEDLYDDDTLSTNINGRKFIQDGQKNSSMKYQFAKYVYNNYEQINFTNFIPLLDNIVRIIKDFNECEIEL